MMRARVCRAASAALTAALLWSGSAGAAEPTPDPVSPTVWLKGAFGRVPGGPVDEPATAAPDGRPLDAWMRRAPLELTTDLPADQPASVSVATRPLEERDTRVLATDAGLFSGPDQAGTHVVVATLSRAGREPVERAWLVEVPDRSGGPEVLWEIPGPMALLGPGERAVPGAPGHGCYAYLCVEAGLRPPVETLQPVHLAVGEAPSLRIDDGSAIGHWQGRLEPLDQRDVLAREAEATFADQPSAAPILAGLEPTAAGEWLLEIRVDYDRERGWQWFLFRLIAE